ncbi:hypothetical protein [Streptomyces sp. ICBB 8177]|uniref:hypothetical protein n=1 Tax=Streptomyces sp. ICBB 8177 TaxID=563922 RepID=UPI000D67D180|nr:hypothetical protein [Streptomyces sp. ICBB 8177]PWI43224.1 hypothetical protein CK485_13680 [Streptomyces sp. ICBB 8177]
MSYQNPYNSSPNEEGWPAPPPPEGPQAYQRPGGASPCGENAYGQNPYAQNPYQQPYPPYPGGPVATAPAVEMPGPVKAARVLAYVAFGLLILGAVIGGALAGPVVAGAIVGGGFPVIGLFVCALLFHRAGPACRVTAIVFASLTIASGLAALGRSPGTGLIPLALSVAVVVNLSRSVSGDWFRRPRA